MTLCDNCLSTTDAAKGVPVGHDQGSQRDPYRAEVRLCDDCAAALLAGRWDEIHERYSAERQVRRDG